MEDERIVPVPISVYKAEVWHHLGFYGNVHTRDRGGASATSVLPHPIWREFARGAAGGSVATRLQLSLVLGAFCAVGAMLASQSRRFHTEHKYKLKNLWNPSWKVLRMFNICINFIVLKYFVFFRNPASTLFFINTKQMYFFVHIKMLLHCILEL